MVLVYLGNDRAANVLGEGACTLHDPRANVLVELEKNGAAPHDQRQGQCEFVQTDEDPFVPHLAAGERNAEEVVRLCDCGNVCGPTCVARRLNRP